MSREKMAHVEEVVNVFPIDGADNIEAVQVLGWVCVAKKGTLKIGDKCVYIEIDSVCPPTEMFSFLEPRKYRVKTIRLRKQISQGLVLPLDDEILALIGSKTSIGEDVTDELKIIKHESESDKEGSKVYKNTNKQWLITRFMLRFAWFRAVYHFLFGKRAKGFPEWIQKTDEERIQSNPNFYLSIKDPSYVSEKLDGQSGTYFIQKTNGFLGFGRMDIGMCSRNIRKGENSTGSWSDIWRRLEVKKKLKDMMDHFVNLGYDCSGVAFQGEIIGPDIQGNKYKRTENEFYLFRAMWKDSKGKTTYLDMQELLDLAKRNNLTTVPILDKNFKGLSTLDEMLSFAEAKSVIIKLPVEREGVVIRTHNQKTSYKVISNKFLLKNEE